MSRQLTEREMIELGQVRECRVCGCTDDNACVGDDGRPCHWVAADLCSACAEISQSPIADLPAGYVERASGLAVPERYV